MSQENVELTRQAFDAFNRRDLPASLALMDEGVKSVSAMSGVATGRGDSSPHSAHGFGG